MGISFEPLYDNVVIARDTMENVLPSGIVLPNEDQKKASRGKVIAAGHGFRANDGSLHPLKVKEGDTVYFSKYAGQELDVRGEKVLVVSEAEIKLIIHET